MQSNYLSIPIHFFFFDSVKYKQFETVSSTKVLGVTISSGLKWSVHIDSITTKAAKRLYLLGQLKDVRANCFCASLLRTQIHMPRHATSCIERAR